MSKRGCIAYAGSPTACWPNGAEILMGSRLIGIFTKGQ